MDYLECDLSFGSTLHDAFFCLLMTSYAVWAKKSRYATFQQQFLKSGKRYEEKAFTISRKSFDKFYGAHFKEKFPSN